LKVISIGEVLWDVFGDQEHLGGAALNFSAHLSKLGHEVAFISAVGDDDRGHRILDRMQQMGLSSRYVRVDPDHATGTVTVTMLPNGQHQFLLHRPAAYDFPQLFHASFHQIFRTPVEWIYFGTLHQVSPVAKALTSQLVSHAQNARRFYDLNLRPHAYNAALVSELMSQASVMKMNDEEVATIAKLFDYQLSSLERFCRDFADKFRWDAVCVTRGAQGCSLLIDRGFVDVPGYSIKIADTVGAGDAFAAAFVHGISSGWPPDKVGDFANRVGALVASRHGAIPPWSIAEVESLNSNTQIQEPA
jgi:fructokinase